MRITLWDVSSDFLKGKGFCAETSVAEKRKKQIKIREIMIVDFVGCLTTEAMEI
jgi:hypothetical protein